MFSYYKHYLAGGHTIKISLNVYLQVSENIISVRSPVNYCWVILFLDDYDGVFLFTFC